MNIVETNQESLSSKNTKRRLLIIPILVISLIVLIYLSGWLYYYILPQLPLCNDSENEFKTQVSRSETQLQTTPTPKPTNSIIYKSESEIPPLEQWPIYNDPSILNFRYRPDMTITREGGNNIIIKNDDLGELFFYMKLAFKHDLAKSPLNVYALDYCSNVSIDPYFSGLAESCSQMIRNSSKNFNLGEINGLEFDYNPHEDQMHGMVFKINNFIVEVNLIGGETGSEVTEKQIKLAKIILETLEFPLPIGILKTSTINGWKTFRSIYNYEFSYPGEWKDARLDTNNNGAIELSYTVNGKDYTFGVPNTGGGGPQADEIKDKKIFLDGNKFTKRTWIKDGCVFFVAIMPETNSYRDHNSAVSNNIESIIFTLPQENNADYQILMDKVLATFKFFDKK